MSIAASRNVIRIYPIHHPFFHKHSASSASSFFLNRTKEQVCKRRRKGKRRKEEIIFMMMSFAVCLLTQHKRPINQCSIVNCNSIINCLTKSLLFNMSTTSNTSFKLDDESSTTSNETVLRHLVLDDSTERTSTTITYGEYSESETLEPVRILQGSNIKCIGEWAFLNCKSLRSVHIDENTVTSIGKFAVVHHYNQFSFQMASQPLDSVLFGIVHY